MDALIASPRASLAELSKATRLFSRTVRKRRDDLLAKQLITVLPNLDTSREPGLIVYSGYVGVERREHLDQIAVPGLIIFRVLHEPPGAWFLGHAVTLAEVQSVERTLRSIPGVSEVNLGAARPGIFATARLREWIRMELKRWDASLRYRGT
jgi:hypothetical protein